MSVTVEDVLSIGYVQAQNIASLGGTPCAGVSTDSRSVRPGEVFFALRGETFDGHAFLDAAFERGALCAVVDRAGASAARGGRPVIVVEDTTKAYGELAHAYRKRFQIPFIAVAGSNGKTTTKEMITAVLKTKHTVLSTEGNLNNHIGVPQTLLRLEPRHTMAVVEVGTNHFGEIGYLSRILEPTHGIITNVGHEHMEYFGDMNGVARAEGELFSSLGDHGVGYVNADDQLLVAQAAALRTKVTYGFSDPAADIRGTALSVDAQGRASFSVGSRGASFDVRLGVPGKHMMANGLAAAAVGLSHGIDGKEIGRALGQFAAVSKRMQILSAGGVTIVNDCYNANPDSVRSALETVSLMACGGKKIIVLGDMLELGAASPEEHRKIGREVSRLQFGYLLTFGPAAAAVSEAATAAFNRHFQEKGELAEALRSLLAPGDLVLVKGSRGMKMEEIVSFVQQNFGGTPS
jgi:UDP-N-acetylmuramoyl-tripeptide--D-alanyl-D-alanine ligase